MEVKVMTATRTAGVEITAEDTSQVVNVFTTTPNIYILAMYARVKTAFAGVTGPTVKLGTPTTTDLYVAEQGIALTGDLYTRQTAAYEPSGIQSLVHKQTEPYVGEFRSQQSTIQCRTPISYQAAPKNIPIVATFGSSSGNLSALTAGEIEFVMVYAE